MNSFLGILGFFEQAALPQPNFIGRFIQLLYEWIGSFGWTIIVFTIMLKVITLPLDYWQKMMTKRNAVKMEDMKPLIANIDKQYAHDQRKANEEKNKLFKKQGYSVASSCLPVIITMAIFIIMFTGLNSYTNYISKRNHQILDRAYTQAFEAAKLAGDDDFEALDKGKEAAALAYTEEIQEKFLWINNIWRPDTWSHTMADSDSYVGGGMGSTALTPEERAQFDKVKYDILYQAVLEVNPGYFSKTGGDGKPTAGWNGLLILPVLSIGLSLLSAFITQKQSAAKTSPGEAPDPSQQSGKIMMFLMPIMMGAFALMYTAAFAVYMVSNYLFTIIGTFIMQPIVDAKVAKEKKAAQQVSYKR